MIIMLKILSGFLIGKFVGNYFAKNELNFVLGMALVVALTLLTCTLLDHIYALL